MGGGILGCLGLAFIFLIVFRAGVGLMADDWRDSKAGELIVAAIRSAIEKTADAVNEFNAQAALSRPWYVKLDFFFKRHVF